MKTDIVPHIISAVSEQDLFELLESQLDCFKNENFHAVITHDFRKIDLFFEADAGSGTQGSYEKTLLRIELNNPTGFIFKIKSKDLISRLFVWFRKDVFKLGVKKVDKCVYFFGTDKEKLAFAINNDQVLKVLTSLKDFEFSIKFNKQDADAKYTLEFAFNRSIFDTVGIREVYKSFRTVVQNIEDFDEYLLPGN